MTRWGLAAVAALTMCSAKLSAQDLTVMGRAATFTFGGRLHLQYSYSSPDGAEPADVFVRRARFITEIKVSDFLDARVQPDFAGGKVALQDAWVRFTVSPAFRLSAGQFQRAHEIFERTSSTELSVIERDGRVSGVDDCVGTGGVCSLGRLVHKLDYAGRDVGLRLEGKLGGRLSYNATLTNGTGVNVPDENDAKSASARVTYAVGDGVALSGYYGVHDYERTRPDDSIETDFGHAGGVDLEVGDFMEGFHFMAGVVQGDNWKAGPSATFRAAQAIATWYRPVASSRFAAWEPVLRVGWADPDTDGVDDEALLVTPGLMVYVLGRNRVGANVDVYSPAVGDTSWSLKVQTYLYF